MTAAGVLSIVLALGAPQPQAPSPPGPPPPPTGLILGRVVDAASGRPVAGAIVTIDGTGLSRPGTPYRQPRAMTNASGQFVFRKLGRGSFSVSVTRPGYVDGSFGRRRPDGTSLPIRLADGERLSDVVIPIWRYASVSGMVTDEAGEPLIDVQVRAFQRRIVGGRRRLVQGPFGRSDDRGFYRIASLAPGDYVFAVVWRESSVPVATAATVSGASGDPKLAALWREVLTMGIGLGGTGGSQSAVVVGGSVRDLPAGSVTPPASAAGSPVYIYPTQFYPGVPSLTRAANVALASGQERDGIDFALTPAPAVRVSGSLVGPDGPMANTGLRLIAEGNEMLASLETSVTMTGAAGDFTFLGVPAGQYTIRTVRVPRPPMPPPTATPMTEIQVGSSVTMTTGSRPPDPGNVPPPPVPDDPTMFTETPVTVGNRDISDLLVTMQRGPRVTGRFEFDGASQRPDAAVLVRMPVTLERADAAPPLGGPAMFPDGHADESGAFKTYGVAPGRYLIRIPDLMPGWTVRSIVADGRDVSEVPIDLRGADLGNVVVTFTDRQTQLTGVARTTQGNADADALVVVFPADSAAWSDYGPNPRRVRSLRVSRTGTYAMSGLPPGEYNVAAIREETIGPWRDPQVLEELARGATQVRLAEGESRTLDLRTLKGGGR